MRLHQSSLFERSLGTIAGAANGVTLFIEEAVLWVYRICLACAIAATSLAHAQVTSDRGALVRVDGGGAPAGLGLLLLNLDKESRLQWSAVNVEASDVSLTALLARVNQWPVGAMTKATESLICDRNPHVCCPYSPTSLKGAREKCLRDLRMNTAESVSPQIQETRQRCRAELESYVTDRSAAPRICAALWKFTPTPAVPTTTEACSSKGNASPWSVCVPNISVREQIGVQDLPFNPAMDKSARAKFELVQGCVELSPSDRAICRAAFSEAKLNAFNFGDYLARARREGKITLPTRAFTIEIPASDSAGTRPTLTRALQGTAEALKAHDRAGLKIDWIERIQRTSPQTQQGPMKASSVSTVPTQQALRVMGLDALMRPIAKSAPILVMDPRPLAKGNARLQAPLVNAFSAREVAGPRTRVCPTKSTVAYKPQEWFSQNPFENPGHASEVIGAMAARPFAGSPVYGVLTKASNGARVYALYFDDGKGDPGDQVVVEQIYEIRPVLAFWNAGCTHIFPIVNVSLKFANEGPPDAMPVAEGVLFGRASEPQYALYVVAAGNPDSLNAPRKRTQQNCTHLPGCKARDTQNMISVVGLDASGELPSSRSLSGISFETAAIGDIMTVDFAGKDKEAYGSSYATPFVSSLASLIVGKAYALRTNGGGLQPADLKVRILQTVDFLRDRSIVEFGRINYSRAIEIGRDILVLDAPLSGLKAITAPFCQGATGCYVGDIRKTGVLRNIKGFDSSGASVEVKELEVNRILRLRRTGRSAWSVVYVELATDSAKARVLHDVRIDDLDQFAFSFPGEGERTVPLSVVQDYTRCMWRKGNDGVCLGGSQ